MKIGNSMNTGTPLNTDTNIARTAERIVADLIARAGGRLPADEAGWHGLLEDNGVTPLPWTGCKQGFTAELWFAAETKRFFACYNPSAPTPTKIKYLAHELVEYLQARTPRSKIALKIRRGLPPVDAATQEFCHRVARHAEGLVAAAIAA